MGFGEERRRNSRALGGRFNRERGPMEKYGSGHAQAILPEVGFRHRRSCRLAPKTPHGAGIFQIASLMDRWPDRVSKRKSWMSPKVCRDHIRSAWRIVDDSGMQKNLHVLLLHPFGARSMTEFIAFGFVRNSPAARVPAWPMPAAMIRISPVLELSILEMIA